MEAIKRYKKGEHVLLEMEITKLALVDDELVYNLKVAGEKDYLNGTYPFERLIPVNNQDEDLKEDTEEEPEGETE